MRSAKCCHFCPGCGELTRTDSSGNMSSMCEDCSEKLLLKILRACCLGAWLMLAILVCWMGR